MNELPASPHPPAFADVLGHIQQARQRVFAQANTALIDLYWHVGQTLSHQVAQAGWGKGVVADLARYIAAADPSIKGFSDKNLWRMKQFYEAYQAEAGDAALSTLLRALPWSHNLAIFSRCKALDERRFYLGAGATEIQARVAPGKGARQGAARRPGSPPGQAAQRRIAPFPGATLRAGAICGATRRCRLVVGSHPTPRRRLDWPRNSPRRGPGFRSPTLLALAVRERYTFRELERQISTSTFERSVAAPATLSTALGEPHPAAGTAFKDRYVLEFLGLPEPHSEGDLQRALVRHMKAFVLELGRDFLFVGEEFRLQVGSQDFFLDLLFFHCGLSALVAFELKVGPFKPEHMGQLNFYLEALDRDVKKPHENPSIGVLLCRDKDDEVVEYALSRNLSPALVAQYELQLPDKHFIAARLHDLLAMQGDVGNE